MATSLTIRKIVAPSGREALRLVRECLGADAMIMSTRVVSAGVEIEACGVTQSAAAQGLDPLFLLAPLPPATFELAAAQPAAVSLRPSRASRAAGDPILNELHSMRGMIEEQLAGMAWNEKQRRDPVRGHLLRTLLGAGFSARQAKSMLEDLPTGQSYACGMDYVKAELVRTVPLLEDENVLMDQGGVYALMGPTGVGKTTTTAKLAARCVMRFGAEKLALVTTDSYRIGAYEQLRIYGKILGVAVHAVKDGADLALVLADLSDKHMVLIDTVGMSQRDRAVSDQIAMLCSSARPVKRLLLLNASCHGDTLNEVVNAYRHGAGGNDLAGCIFTKLDEATHPGALLDTVIRHRLPVYYVSSGQKVPEHLVLPDRHELVHSVFHANSRSALFVPGEADLQGPAGGAGAPDAVAHAQAETERLRLQYQQLIKTIAHDAEQLADTASALTKAELGFETARRLWRQSADGGIDQKAVLKALSLHARSEMAAGCDHHVLALCGQLSLSSTQGADAYELHSCLLLSDRTGRPLAAPNQWLAMAAPHGASAVARKVGMRQRHWLRQQDFGKAVVHVLPKLPAPDLLAEWQAQRLRWLARVAGSTVVVDPATRAVGALSSLALVFGPERPTRFRGRAAQQSDAHADVVLRTGAAAPNAVATTQGLVLRCVVTRIMDADSGKPLAQWYLLSNLGSEVAAEHIARWQAWAFEAEPCFRLLKQGIPSLGGIGAPGDPDLMKRLLIGGQLTTTVWRLLHATGEWADRAHGLLTHLAGRGVRPDRPLPGHILFEGMCKLFVLLDALGAESPPPQAADVLARQD